MFGVPAARIIRCRVISRRMRLGARVSVILDESILEGRERGGGGDPSKRIVVACDRSGAR